MESPLQVGCRRLTALPCCTHDSCTTRTSALVLDLSHQGLTDTDAAVLGKALLRNKATSTRINNNLTSSTLSINLSHNKIGPFGAFLLCKGLRFHADSDRLHLSLLDLSHNRIGNEGAVAVARVLQSITCERIRLDGNMIGNDGCLAIVHALTVTGTDVPSASFLKELSLHNNFLGTASAMALAHLLRSNTSIHTIRLGRNNIGPDGYKALRDTMKNDNTTVSDFELSESIGGLPWSDIYKRDIQFYAQLNQYGRKSVRDIMLPTTLYSQILSRVSASPELLYVFVSERPDLLRAR